MAPPTDTEGGCAAVGLCKWRCVRKPATSVRETAPMPARRGIYGSGLVVYVSGMYMIGTALFWWAEAADVFLRGQ